MNQSVIVILDTSYSSTSLSRFMNRIREKVVEKLSEKHDELVDGFRTLAKYLKTKRSQHNSLFESILDDSLDVMMILHIDFKFPPNLLNYINNILPMRDLFFYDDGILFFNNLKYFYNTKNTKFIQYLKALENKEDVFKKLSYNSLCFDSNSTHFDYYGSHQMEYYELITIAMTHYPSLMQVVCQKVFQYQPAIWLFFHSSDKLKQLDHVKFDEIHSIFVENISEISQLLERKFSVSKGIVYNISARGMDHFNFLVDICLMFQRKNNLSFENVKSYFLNRLKEQDEESSESSENESDENGQESLGLLRLMLMLLSSRDNNQD